MYGAVYSRQMCCAVLCHTSCPLLAQELGKRLQQLLGPINNGIMDSALAAMAAGDAAAVGALMTEAQAAFDAAARPCCPSQLTAPVLHQLLQFEPLRPLVWGGKGVGSQGDGTCQLLCRSAEAQQQVSPLHSLWH